MGRESSDGVLPALELHDVIAAIAVGLSKLPGIDGMAIARAQVQLEAKFSQGFRRGLERGYEHGFEAGYAEGRLEAESSAAAEQALKKARRGP